MKTLHKLYTQLRKFAVALCAQDLRHILLFGVLCVALLLVVLLSLCMGTVQFSASELGTALFGTADPDSLVHRIVWYTRIPRTCGSMLAGAALAVSGCVIQSVLANPLAAPNVIGVNAGAGFSVVLFCAMLPNSVVFAPLAACVGAFLGVVIVLSIAEVTGASKMTLVLSGMAISSLMSAGIDAVITFVPDALNGYSDFRIGGFSGMTLDKLTLASALILVGFVGILLLAHALDILMLGSESAQTLGLSVRPVRLCLLGFAAVLAGAAVSFSGLIGFVGLVVPHTLRRLIGEESLPLIACSAVGGAAFVTLCDLAARTIFAPYELPVGIMLAFVGAPFFLLLLFRTRGGHRV